MPVKETAAAAAKIKKLRRYVTTLGWTKGKGFAVRVTHGTRARNHRILKVSTAAKAAIKRLGSKTLVIGLKGKDFTHRIRHASLNKRALRLAASQIGYTETPPGSNHTKYGEWYGMDLEPWCAIFDSWVLSHVGRPFKESYVPTIVAKARNKQDGLTAIPFGIVASTMKAGFPVLACYDWQGDGIADHVEFVEKVVDSNSFFAIGGNTGAINLSNGGEVLRSKRAVVSVQQFVKVSKSS